MNHPPGMPHRKQLYAVIAARPPRRTLQGCTPAERPVEPAGRTVPDRARDCAVWAGCQAACAEAAGLGCGADRPMRAHMHPAGTRTPRARNCGSRGARFLLLLLLLLLLACCCCCCCCCCSTHSLEDPNLQGPHQSHAGARTPSCPRLCAALRTTSERARSPLPALGQASCGFLTQLEQEML